jgi:hypothetical protein
VSGTNPRDFFLLPDAGDDVGVMWFHGTQDNTVPHDGDPASDSYFYEATANEIQRVGAAFGCDPDLTPWTSAATAQAPGNANLVCQQYDNCPEAYSGAGLREVVHCLWSGGHTWPKQQGGPGADWGNEVMFAFLLQHSRQALEPFCPATSCVPPDQPTFVEGTEASVVANLVAWTFQDLNQPEQVTGYNVYRSEDPSLDPALWDLLASDHPDEDLVQEDVQWAESAAPALAAGSGHYYRISAVNSLCPAEGPR